MFGASNSDNLLWRVEKADFRRSKVLFSDCDCAMDVPAS